MVTSVGGTRFLALRPLLNEFTVTMPRGAAVVYPKDAAQMLVSADIFPGARVLEAGAGSGALTCYLLRAIGEAGRLISVRAARGFRDHRAPECGELLRRPASGLGDAGRGTGRCPSTGSGRTVDRAMLDMLAPWDFIDALADVLMPGGVLAAYVATTTQLARTVETIRVHGGFTEPEATRDPGPRLARRRTGRTPPARHGRAHRLLDHRAADGPGCHAPLPKRRPAPGAYGEDYSGPRAEPR